MKKNIAVMFGGKSSEHDISVLTGFQIVNNFDKNKFRIVPIYITKENEWYLVDKIDDINNINNKKKIPKKVCFCTNYGNLFIETALKKYKFYKKIDVCVLAFHGKNGEDGTIQGLLELQNLPYTSSPVLSSAVCLDKYFMKMLLKSLNYSQAEFYAEKKQNDEKIKCKFEFPVVVKPSKLGSSIGISFCKNQSEFEEAVKLAFVFDDKIIIEKSIQNLVEYNCAVMEFSGKIIASEIEQPIKFDEILSFKDKYLNSQKGKFAKGMKGLTRIIPAKISRKLKNEITELSKNLFRDFECSGVVRIDFMFDKKLNKLYVNEINSIPGSLAFYLFENKGISFPVLLDGLIDSAINTFNKKNEIISSFNSGIKF